eukprot:496471_1
MLTLQTLHRTYHIVTKQALQQCTVRYDRHAISSNTNGSSTPALNSIISRYWMTYTHPLSTLVFSIWCGHFSGGYSHYFHDIYVVNCLNLIRSMIGFCQLLFGLGIYAPLPLFVRMYDALRPIKENRHIQVVVKMNESKCIGISVTHFHDIFVVNCLNLIRSMIGFCQLLFGFGIYAPLPLFVRMYDALRPIKENRHIQGVVKMNESKYIV